MRLKNQIDRSKGRGFRFLRLFSVSIAVDCLFLPSSVFADETITSRPANLRDWHFDPALLLNVALIVWLYMRGIRKLGQSTSTRRAFGTLNLCCFFGGLLLLVICLISPLDFISSQLSSAHMVQHMTVMTVAAPLFALGSPSLLLALGMPPAGKAFVRRARSVIRWVNGSNQNGLVACWTFYAVAMWTWHLPVFYESALRNPIVHDLQHLSFFLAAVFFWRPLVDPFYRPKPNRGVAVFYLFTTTLHATILGVFMTVAPSPWYPHYSGLTELWNLSPLEDQQLAGLIMWMPACVTYAICALILFGAVLARDSQPAEQFAITANGRV